MSKTNDSVRNSYSADKLGIAEMGPGSLASLLEDHLTAMPNKPIMMIGEPGIGKTAIIMQLEATNKYHILVIRLVNEDEGTMNGYADPDAEGGTVTLRVVRKVKEAAEQAKQEGKRLIVFFDEVNRAKDHMVKYVFNILDTKRWGDFLLPSDTSFIAAINPPTKNHKVRDVLSDSAIRRRFVVYGCKADNSEYLAYARKAKIHPAVTGFLSSKPKHIYDYVSLDNGRPYACPASWDSISETMYWYEDVKKGKMGVVTRDISVDRMLTGTMGEAMTYEFLTYAEDMTKRFSPKNMLSNYAAVRKEIKDTVNSEFTEEDADLDLSKLLTVSNTLACYIADKLINADMNFHFSKETINEKGITKKEALKVNKQGLNLALFLADCPSEIFQAFYATLKRELTELLGANSSTMHVHLSRTNQLTNYQEYQDAANKYMEARR